MSMALIRAGSPAVIRTGENTADARRAAAIATGMAEALAIGTAGGWYDSAASGAADPSVAEGDGFFVLTGGRFYIYKKVGGVGVKQAEFSTVAMILADSGLGTIASQDADDVTIEGGSITGITDLAIADGGTGASTAAAARANLGLTTSGMHLLGTFAGDGTTGTYTFSGIDQTYTDLVVKFTARRTGNSYATLNVTVNALGASGYDAQRGSVTANSTAGAEDLAAANLDTPFFNIPGDDATAGFAAGGEMEILHYTSTALFKQMLFRARAVAHLTSGAGYSVHGTGQARTLSAISSLTLALSAGNFASGSRIDLYGRR